MYILRDLTSGCLIDNVDKAEIILNIKRKKIDNATIQVYEGNTIIRVKDDVPTKIDYTGQKKSRTSTKIIEHIVDDKDTTELFGMDAVNNVIKLSKGTPIQIKVGEYSDWKQALFMGIDKDSSLESSKLTFFDGCGISGIFQFSMKYIADNPNKVRFKLNDNNPVEVSKLLSSIKNSKKA